MLVALQAMRVGLLTRFMGYLGIFTGVLVLFPIGSPVPVVQGFWLLALAYLFSGRWPNGVPPSWRSGRAEKWPSSAELREQRMKASGAAAVAAAGRSPRRSRLVRRWLPRQRSVRARPRASASASAGASSAGLTAAGAAERGTESPLTGRRRRLRRPVASYIRPAGSAAWWGMPMARPGRLLPST